MIGAYLGDMGYVELRKGKLGFIVLKGLHLA